MRSNKIETRLELLTRVPVGCLLAVALTPQSLIHCSLVIRAGLCCYLKTHCRYLIQQLCSGARALFESFACSKYDSMDVLTDTLRLPVDLSRLLL